MRFERVRDPDPLRLLRSYDIPADDPAYDRLLNLSWTYDSAIGAVAFAVAGERKQAEQLLDQLQALQRTDGSIDFAYHTLTGAGAELERSGTVAWVGLAAALYEDVYNSSRYKAVAEGAARWLLARQVRDSRSRAYGLVVGGPDVTWVSTQHNLVTWFLLRSLRDEGSRSTREARAAAAELIAQGVDRALLVRPASGPAYFVQGVDDAVRPLDVQTLGILHLLARGRAADALRVAESVRTDFAVSGRSIAVSSDPTSYNRTYSASGPFSGFRPYPGTEVLWMEGTAQARLVLRLLAADVRALDASVRDWGAVTASRAEGPLGADRTLSVRGLNEYHAWPTSAAAGWTLLAYGGGGERLLGLDDD